MTFQQTDLAWFAGWLSADGSITYPHAHDGPRIVFKLTDRDPLDQFSALFGGAVHGPYDPTGFGTKQVYTWGISGTKATEILRLVFPWLSARYQEKAERGLSYIRSRGRALTVRDVQQIKRKFRDGGHGIGRQLAREYGVTDGMICNIKNGRAWADVEP